ncbi:MAG: glucose-6-phosphate isomerase [bacterium]|nr:MAG: glucose-6-phosphate isomerase [bacterium]
MKKENIFHLYLADYEHRINQSLEKFKSEKVLSRIWSHDYTLWSDSPDEITNRLGWLKSPETMETKLSEIDQFVKELITEGLTTAVLLGMGGSSLAPEVYRKTFGVKPGYLDLTVLDSTDPGAVLQIAEKYDPEKTIYVVSTKSGGTVETLSFMKYFYNLGVKYLGKKRVGKHFVAITDPGSGLGKMANELRFRKIFLNDPNIGGRYSALTFFGLVPAALLGIDLQRLIKSALKEVTSNSPEIGKNSWATLLGVSMAVLAENHRDKLTFILSNKLKYLGVWIEQLIAESTGKAGKGILPVVEEEILDLNEYSQDRQFIFMQLDDEKEYQGLIKNFSLSGHPVCVIVLNDLYDIGKEFFRWELATAIAGWYLKINPFDQPNVEAAKILARDRVKAYQESGLLEEGEPLYQSKKLKIYGNVAGKSIREIVKSLLKEGNTTPDLIQNRSYLSIQAYLKPDLLLEEYLQQLRAHFQKKYKIATTVGYGPRFLHSTGQLHKGDAGNGLFIQLSAHMPDDVEIPEDAGDVKSSISFGILKKTQYLGDFEALKAAGRKLIRIDLGKKPIENIKYLLGELSE